MCGAVKKDASASDHDSRNLPADPGPAAIMTRTRMPAPVIMILVTAGVEVNKVE